MNQADQAFSTLEQAAEIFPQGIYHQLVKAAYLEGKINPFELKSLPPDLGGDRPQPLLPTADFFGHFRNTNG